MRGGDVDEMIDFERIKGLFSFGSGMRENRDRSLTQLSGRSYRILYSSSHSNIILKENERGRLVTDGVELFQNWGAIRFILRRLQGGLVSASVL